MSFGTCVAYNTDRDKIGKQRRAAVGDKRQRDSGNRQQADNHTDILKLLKQQQLLKLLKLS